MHLVLTLKVKWKQCNQITIRDLLPCNMVDSLYVPIVPCTVELRLTANPLIQPPRSLLRPFYSKACVRISTDLASKSARIVDFCGKSSGLVDFENTVDRGSALHFGADSGLCLS